MACSGDALLIWWNIGAVATVVLPLLILLIGRLVRMGGDGEGDGGGGGDNWGGPENEGRGVTIFAYFWSLLAFIGLAIFGNYVLGGGGVANVNRSERGSGRGRWCARRNNGIMSSPRDAGILAGGVLMFANFALVLFILIGGHLIDFDRAQDEGLGFGRGPMIVPLTFLLWTIFCGVFAIILLTSCCDSRGRESDNSSNYQKYDDSNERKQSTKRGSFFKKRSNEKDTSVV